MIRKKKAGRPARRPVKKTTANRGPARKAATASPKRPRAPARDHGADRRDAEPVAPIAAPVLPSKRKRELRADAHALEPIVHVGHGGVNEAIVRAVSRALLDHELIKVRLHEPEDKHSMANELAEAAHAALCGLVGHTVILFRPKPKAKSVSGIARSAIKRNQGRRGRR